MTMEELKPQVREYAGPVILIGIVILAGFGIALIWGLDPRWLYSASVAFVLAFVLAAASDGRRREKAFQAARKARDEAERELLDGPFEQALHNFSTRWGASQDPRPEFLKPEDPQ
jgi:hypothetical protein